MMLAMFIIGAILGNMTVSGLKLTLGLDFAEAYGNIISYPIMFIPAIVYAAIQNRRLEDTIPGNTLDEGHFGKMGGIVPFLISIPAVVATAYVVEPVVALLPQMPQWLEDIMKQLLEKSPLWVTIISVSVFAPLFEEWLCRGIVLRGLLANGVSPTSAIVASSVFFAVLHINPWQAIPAFILGCLFGYVYYRTGSLKLTMFMHCVNNSAAIIFSKIPSFKEAETFMDVLSPWAYWSIYATCLLIAASSIVIFSSTGYKK